METTTIQTKPEDDEIVVSLVEQKMVVHDTVRLNVLLKVQRDPDVTEEAMRASIRTALRKFIDTEWRFVSIVRSRGQTRFEEVAVQAVARVSEAENTMLVERANAVSAPGLELVAPSATYALPFDKVQQINRDLRIALVAQARSECAEYNTDGCKYRVALIEFADTPRAGGGAAAANMRAGSTYTNSPTASGTYAGTGGSEMDTEEGAPDLGVSERFWVAAQVTFRQAV